MKKIGPLLFGVILLVVGYLYVGGSLSSEGAQGGNGGKARDAGGELVDKGKDSWGELTTQPWFYTAAAAVILGVLGVMLWQKIGNFGRMTAMLLLGIGLAVFLFKVGR